MANKTAAAAETEEWMAFLANAIGGLRQAAVELRGRKADYESKRDWFRKAKTGIPRENSVSQALKQLFDIIRAEQQISGSGVQPIDLRHIRIECELPRPFDPGISDEANPTDFSLVLMKNNELDFRIEAKTILNDAEVKRHYLSADGLLRFDDNSNPYTIQPFGGMIAYVVDSDAKTWTGKIGSAVAAAVGAGRAGKLKIGNEDHHVSRHKVDYKAGGKAVRRDVDVVHFALEIDAKPPKR
jgi:hypothetical protein